MKRTQTCLLALLLSVVMLVGLLPVSSIAAETLTSYTYNYRKLKWGQWSNEGYAPSYVTSFDMTTEGNASELNDYEDVPTDPWMFGGMGGGASVGWNSSSASYGPYMTGGAGAYSACTIRVAAAGTYWLVPRYSTGTFGAKVKYYFAPASASNPRDNAYYVGTIDTYETSIRADLETRLAAKSLSAGDYIVSYVFDTASNGAATSYYFTNAFLLNGVVDEYSFDVDSVVVSEGGEHQQELGLTLNGTAISIATATGLTAVSTDPSVATASISSSADGARAYISVYGHDKGTATIIITATANGKSVLKNLPVTVNSPSSDLILTHDAAASYTIEAGTTQVINLSASYGGAPIDLNNVSLVATADDDTVVRGEIVKKADGTALAAFAGLKKGKTNVDIAAYYEGNSTKVSASFTITSRADEYCYNLMKLFYGPWSDNGYDPKTVTEFSMTTEGSADEITPETPSSPWVFDSMDSGSTVGWTSSSAGRGPVWTTPVGGWVKYRIRLDESGIYTPKTTYSSYKTLGNVTYYLAPVDAIDPTDDLYRLAVVNAYSTTDNNNKTYSFRKLNLAAGEYILTLVMTGKNSAIAESVDPSFFLKNFILEKPSIGTFYGVTDVNESVAVGATKRFEVILARDGFEVEASRASKLTVRSAKSATAKATLVMSEDGKKAYVDVTGVAEGYTSITLSATVDGRATTHSALVSVKPGDLLGKVKTEVLDDTLAAGERSGIKVAAYTMDGTLLDNANLDITFTSSDTTVLVVNANGSVAARNQGTAKVTVTVSDGVSSVTLVPIPFTVTGYSALESAYVSNVEQVPVGGTLKLRVGGLLQYGAAMPENMATATYTLVSASPSGAATLSNGVLTGVAAGSVTVRATVTFQGKTVTTPDRTITIRSGKTRSTFYTEAKRKNVEKNAKTYVWANNEVKMYTSLADKYVGQEEFLWNLITTQELPRSIRVGYRYDPKHNICRYCGADIVAMTGTNYAFKYDVDANPWKVQCPACTRYFPSNDFEKFYRSGINSYGNWSYEQAKKYGSAYLTNDLYPEKGEGWGVDDGYGYRTGTYFATGIEGLGNWEETHTYIAYYNHWALWNGYIPNVATATALAYVYSGDPKYGRVAAIMVDRVADIYPAMDTGVYDPKYWNNGWYGGKTLGGIWETSNVSKFAKAYDAVFDLYDDSQVISFLSNKATKYHMTNKKTAGNSIRQNIDDNYLRVAIEAITDGSRQIYGNFGFHQSAAVDAAVVLDTQPETNNVIEWALNGEGAVNSTIMTTVSRDGAGNETSPNYNFNWAAALYDIMETLGGYDKYSANLYTNAKVIKMLKMNFPLTLMRKATAQIGDTEGVDVHNLAMSAPPMIPAFLATNDIELGQMIYFLNGNKTTGLAGSIFNDTQDLSDKLQNIIDTYGEYPFDKSTHLTDYGFAILRSGTLQGKDDTQRDIWMTHGITQGHGQYDKLNIGIDAFGLCLAPDMGYPSTTLGTGDIVNWERSTIIHNTVQVNNQHQVRNYSSDRPLHFDDDGHVKVMDVRSPSAYSGTTSEYRRSVVMVDVDDEHSYYVDFFRVIGGSTHIYSFHALSDSVASTSGLNLVSRAGTYAGVNVPYGPGNVESGHDGLLAIEEDLNPSKNFAVDFLINDFRSQATKDGELHLRMTQLNDFQADDVTTAQGRPPIINKNPQWLQFALVRRTGTNLDSLFTTVFEPYCDDRFITKEENVVMMRQSGAAYDGTDKAKAVKITLANGRVDYIVYSTDNQIKWRVDNTFDFMGTFGVYSIENGSPTYAYLCDGTQIGSHTMATSNYTGSITNFTRELTFENYIQVTFDGEVDMDDLVGRFINVNNGTGLYNACYEIKDVTPVSKTSAKLHTGDVTFYRGDSNSYDIATGMTFTIAKSKSFGVEAPSAGEVLTFNAVDTQIAAYESPYSLQIRANSSSGGKVIYKMTSGPAGATFDSLTRTMSWTPTAFGNYSATFTATCNGKTATLTVPITVLAAPPILVQGAQIRLNGVQGLRFISRMDLENIELLEASGATEIEYGTLLIPSADVQDYREIQIGATLNGHEVAKVPAVFIYDITETENIYTAVITNVLEKNYSRAYTARPYLSYKDKDGVSRAVYGNSCVSRSIYQVAKAALNDADRYSDNELATLQGIVDVVEN